MKTPPAEQREQQRLRDEKAAAARREADERARMASGSRAGALRRFPMA